jgi:hypothetical protein
MTWGYRPYDDDDLDDADAEAEEMIAEYEHDAERKMDEARFWGGDGERDRDD